LPYFGTRLARASAPGCAAAALRASLVGRAGMRQPALYLHLLPAHFPILGEGGSCCRLPCCRFGLQFCPIHTCPPTMPTTHPHPHMPVLPVPLPTPLFPCHTCTTALPVRYTFHSFTATQPTCVTYLLIPHTHTIPLPPDVCHAAADLPFTIPPVLFCFALRFCCAGWRIHLVCVCCRRQRCTVVAAWGLDGSATRSVYAFLKLLCISAAARRRGRA